MRGTDFRMLNDLVDVSQEYARVQNSFFIADRLTAFDPATGEGTLRWRRDLRGSRLAFDHANFPFKGADDSGTFPEAEYPRDPELPLAVSFVGPRTIRLRLRTSIVEKRTEASLMLVGEPAADGSWRARPAGDATVFEGAFGSLIVRSDPFQLEFRDASGTLVTRSTVTAQHNTLLNTDPTPLSFVERLADLGRQVALSLDLAPDERVYGCGESFTRLNKRGQKVVLWATDAHGAQSARMYKPIPFFLSSRGFGVFVHTTAPLTCDFGHDFDGAATLHVGEDELDLFVFLGNPKEVLDAYTTLTGRGPLPPLWSFGLWMSRITYFSESEVRTVAARLRSERIPSDVLHLDTGWFETDWRCDYRFSPSRFPDAPGMIADLKAMGIRVCLWQIPYFTPNNVFFPEIVAKGYAIRDGNGGLPTRDAIIDFSNPAAAKWYQERLAGLLRLGVGAIKVDFGEAVPIDGILASGRSGFFEHNLYPLRYNQTAAEVTREVTGENVIWARSAWAGSQRYPLHWGGDAENSDSAMAATLRAGLSLGLCGFSFWSHDAGGFAERTPRALYRRWLPFALLTSHTRCHGAPPKEPWEYDAAFVDDFRRATELKYALMPYVYAQAKDCSERGLPMLRPLFLEYPDDPTSWLVEDEYLFGRDLLVAPLFEETTRRRVYLPPGQWVDYQTGASYDGGWHEIAAGEIPIVLLARVGAAIPRAAVAQSTDEIDWSSLELATFGAGDGAEGLVCLPSEGTLRRVRVAGGAVAEDPFGGRVRWTVRPT